MHRRQERWKIEDAIFVINNIGKLSRRQIANQLSMKRNRIDAFLWSYDTYQKYPDKIRNRSGRLARIFQTIERGEQPMVIEKKVTKPMNGVDGLDGLFENFKTSLVDVLIPLVQEMSRQEVDKAFRKGKAEGAMEEQTKLLEAGKRDNLADMIKRKLMGA